MLTFFEAGLIALSIVTFYVVIYFLIGILVMALTDNDAQLAGHVARVLTFAIAALTVIVYGIGYIHYMIITYA